MSLSMAQNTFEHESFDFLLHPDWKIKMYIGVQGEFPLANQGGSKGHWIEPGQSVPLTLGNGGALFPIAELRMNNLIRTRKILV